MKSTDAPSYLTCPWCPSQAFPKSSPGSTPYTGYLLAYKCHAGHVFYIGENTSFNFKEDSDGFTNSTGRVPE